MPTPPVLVSAVSFPLLLIPTIVLTFDSPLETMGFGGPEASQFADDTGVVNAANYTGAAEITLELGTGDPPPTTVSYTFNGFSPVGLALWGTNGLQVADFAAFPLS